MNEDDISQTLRLMYKEKLPNKIKCIEKEWQNLQTTDEIISHFESFYKAVHKFNGSAGSYGYSEISQVVGKLEVYLKTLNASTPMSVEQKAEIEKMLKEIKEVVETALTSS